MSEVVKKKYRTKDITADFDKVAIVVSYETESHMDDGTVQSKPSRKTIPLKTLNAGTDVDALAEEVAESCRLIPSSRIPLVADLIERIQRDVAQNDYRVENERDREMLREMYDRREEKAQMHSQEPQEVATLENLDDYIGMLYGETEEKIKGTFLILQLARNPISLQYLVQHDSFSGVLSRLLKEDGRKSMDLLINIVYIFFAFSTFTEFHSVMTTNGVGDMIMKTIDLEIKRHNVRMEKHNTATNQAKERGDSHAIADLELEGKKLKMMTRKQEKLLYVCFHVLLNLAEDPTIEMKMKKRNIVKYLATMLERRNTELLILIVTFLKKLSIFKENKDEMGEENVVELVAEFVPCRNEVLLAASLRLLLNLSFDPELCEKMVQCGMIPKLVDLLAGPNLRSVILRLLYHLSRDDRCKSMFTYTTLIPMVLQLITNYPEQFVAKELVALAVNLTANSRNADKICEGDGLHLLMDRLFKTYDPLLMKVIRNISQHETTVKLFKDYVQDLVTLAKDARDQGSWDLLVEVIGTVGNLTIPEYDFATLAVEHDLIPWLTSLLTPEVEDDVILEVVIVVGTLVGDPLVAPLIVEAQVIEILYELVLGKQEDDEMVLQVCYTVNRMLQVQNEEPMELSETQESILNHQKLVSFLVEHLNHNNETIRKTIDQCLDIIMELDQDWAKQIRHRKFQIHNAEWLEVVEEDDMYEDDEYGKDYQQQRHHDEAMLHYGEEEGDDYMFMDQQIVDYDDGDFGEFGEFSGEEDDDLSYRSN